MSTRGAVAFGTPKNWRGVYNHAGSEPRELGAAVWQVVSHTNDIAELERKVIAAGRWESFVAGAVADEPDLLTSEIADPLFIEWVYVIDGRKLHVIAHAPTSERFDAWRYDHVDTFELDGPEPDWLACQKKHSLRHAETRLAHIRKRFGEDAYLQAKKQILGEE